MDIRVSDNPAANCADILCHAAEAGSHIALTGGSTPGEAYRQAAGMGADWSDATLWWGDERCVPPDDELSNYKLAKDALLDNLPEDKRPEVHRMRGETGPHAGADSYERELRDTLGEQTPRLDLVLLGLGPDAHIASLFPRQDTLRVSDRSVVAVPEAGHEPYVPRISLTLPTINAARQGGFLVTGESKAQ